MPGTWPPISGRRRLRSSRAQTTSPPCSGSPPSSGLKVNAQGTGHGAAPLEPLDDTILIRTTRMQGDRGRRRSGYRPGRGRRAGDELGEAAQAYGRCSQPGSSPNVGTIGYTLGGGLGWLGAPYGFACNLVRAIELVTADGEQRRVDAENEPDLFWALRGGGGGYAVVTALEVDLLPVSEAYAGALIFPAELGAEAVRAYRDWAAAVPDEVTSRGRFLRPPPMPDVPEPLRDRPLLDGHRRLHRLARGGRAQIAPLRDLGEPIMDTFDQIPAAGLSRINMDPEPPIPALGHHRLIARASRRSDRGPRRGRRPRGGLAAAAGRARPRWAARSDGPPRTAGRCRSSTRSS